MLGLDLTIEGDLRGIFLGMPYENETGRYHPRAYSIEDAEGLSFLCPVCYINNKGLIGTHTVICWSLNVSQEWFPTPGRWNLVGTGLSDVSLVTGSSSVAIQGPCNAHFWVTQGRISDKKLEEEENG